MILKISADEFDLMREALTQYRRNIREEARPHLAGYSDHAIELCTRRLRVEALLEDLQNREASLPERSDSKVVTMPVRVISPAAESPERVA